MCENYLPVSHYRDILAEKQYNVLNVESLVLSELGGVFFADVSLPHYVML